MEWLLPAGAWAFASVLVVIALYLLRRKATRHEVPSLYLWRRTQAAQEASKPFQMLRKNWLLILQLLLVTLLSVALLRPALTGGLHGEMVLIMDVSASMQAEANGKSRVELAVEDALRLVDGMQEGDAVTVLTAGSAVGQVITRSADKQKVKAALSALKAENGTADMEGAVSLAKAMGRDIPGLSIVVYTDSNLSLEEGVTVRPVGTGAENRAILSLSCTRQEDGLRGFARIANYGAAAEVTVECYADGALCDIRTLSMAEGEQQSVQFSVPVEAHAVWAQITTPDALAADNIRYWASQKQAERRILLVTEGNVFLEKALALREDSVLLKTNPADAANIEGFDLYVLDGACPEPLPQTGSILAWAPDVDILGIHSEAAIQKEGALRAASGKGAQAITQNLLLSETALRAYHPLSGGQSVLTWGGDTLLAVNEQDGRRAAVVGFDLHDSNLPMKADFPILMQNLLDYLLPEAVSAVEGGTCGQPVALVLDDRTAAAQVVTPTGRQVALDGQVLTDTSEIGVYSLTEERTDKENRTTLFTLHMAGTESDVRVITAQAQGGEAASAGQRGRGQELTVWFLLALLLLSLVEWEVSRRGA